MKVLITGAGGMLGIALADGLERAGHDVTRVPRADADVTRPGAIDDRLKQARPDWVVNLAAFTRVDDCEGHEEEALAVNGEGARNVAVSAAAAGARIVHMSTDYVFSGESGRPYREDDPAGPRSVYGRSKLAGELAVREVTQRHVIVRTAWLFGRGGANFIDTILRRARGGENLRVVDDQRGSPTWTVDLANGLTRLMEAEPEGTYHCTSRGDCTWYELALYATERAQVRVRVDRTDTQSLARPAPRPRYSVLDLAGFERATKWQMPQWQSAVDRYLSS